MASITSFRMTKLTNLGSHDGGGSPHIPLPSKRCIQHRCCLGSVLLFGHSRFRRSSGGVMRGEAGQFQRHRNKNSSRRGKK